MDKNIIYKEIISTISNSATVLKDELMSKHTSFKIGGPADVYVKAQNVNDIKNILEYAKDKINLTIIGNGSNLLVRDNGIRGITLQIDLNSLELDEENKIVTIGAGVKLAYLAQQLLKKEIKGLEFASGIPGTIGGAIRMNAGAHGKEMKDIVVSTKYMDRNGTIHEILNKDCNFTYRNSIFGQKDWIILETKLQLEKGNYEEIKNLMTEYANYRRNAQPIEYPSAGSTFKRGEDFITAKLIDECGLKGYNVNGAEVSEKHAGFIINKENAKAKDVLELINIVKEKVQEKCNKKIELEIQVIGE